MEAIASEGADGRNAATCRCSCGWQITTGAATPHLAAQIAARARSNHLADNHPSQSTAASTEPPERGQTVTPHHEHRSRIGRPTRDGFMWTRQLECSCGWADAASERTPTLADDALRARHATHVHDAVGKVPGRGGLLLVGFFVVICLYLVIIAEVLARVGSR